MQETKTEKQIIEEITERLVRNEIYTICSYLFSELLGIVAYLDTFMDLCSQYVNNSEEIEELRDQIEDLENYRDDLIYDVEDQQEQIDDLEYYNKDHTDMFIQEWIEGLEFIIEQDIESLESEIADLESDQEYPTEALEHWIVSDWFADKLEQHGQMVIEFCNLNIWGRTTSGQAIIMDYVMQEIASEVHHARY